MGDRDVKCADCDEPAAYELWWISGVSVPEENHYGFRLSFGQCEGHMAELVRTTDRRYEVKPLTGRARRSKVVEGQTALDV